MSREKSRVRKSVVYIESLGIGALYIGMLAFFLYPVVDAVAYVV